MVNVRACVFPFIVHSLFLCDAISVGLLDVVSVVRGAGMPLFIACDEECFGSPVRVFINAYMRVGTLYLELIQ